MATNSERDPFAVESGERLRRARIAAGYTNMRRFAENTGTDEDNLGNWELGRAVVPAWYIQRLKEVFGITHDWVYGGDLSSLRGQLLEKLMNDDKRR